MELASGKPEIQLCWLDWRDCMAAGAELIKHKSLSQKEASKGFWASWSWCNNKIENNPAEADCEDLVFTVASEEDVSMTAEAEQAWMIIDQAELTHCRVRRGRGIGENKQLPSFSRHWQRKANKSLLLSNIKLYLNNLKAYERHKVLVSNQSGSWCLV